MITSINEFKNHLILEASFEQLYDQFVKTNKISQQIYDDIKKNITKSIYATWLIKRIEDKLILPEDIYKYNEYFDIFDRHKNKFNIKDINLYKTEEDVNNFKSKVLEIKQLEDKDKSQIKGLNKSEKYKEFIIGNVDGFNIYMLPKNNLDNFNISCDLGSGTEWCTATGNTDQYYNKYIKKDNLFILINDSTKQKFQFHFNDNQFMDKKDINIFNDLNSYNVNFYNLFKFITDKYSKYEIPFQIIFFYKPESIDYNNLKSYQWENISQYPKLSEDFIRKYKDKVDWYLISQYQKLSEDFIKEFQNKVHWSFISSYQILFEDFIKEFQHKVNWTLISIYQKLSEDFIREFQDKVEWQYISKYQKLSEPFIREFQDKVNWNLISEYQNLSEPFIREFQNNIDWNFISKNQNISDEIKNNVKKYFI